MFPAWIFQWITEAGLLFLGGYLIFLHRSIIAPFAQSYSTEKAKQYATHEDFSEVLKEQRETKLALERIAADVSRELWFSQTVWKEKRDLYVEAIRGVSTLDLKLRNSAAAIQAKSRDKEALLRLMNETATAIEPIDNFIALFHLFLNEEAQKALDDYASDAPAPKDGVVEEDNALAFLEHASNRAHRLKVNLIKAARNDLGVNRVPA